MHGHLHVEVRLPKMSSSKINLTPPPKLRLTTLSCWQDCVLKTVTVTDTDIYTAPTPPNVCPIYGFKWISSASQHKQTHPFQHCLLCSTKSPWKFDNHELWFLMVNGYYCIGCLSQRLGSEGWKRRGTKREMAFGPMCGRRSSMPVYSFTLKLPEMSGPDDLSSP